MHILPWSYNSYNGAETGQKRGRKLLTILTVLVAKCCNKLYSVARHVDVLSLLLTCEQRSHETNSFHFLYCCVDSRKTPFVDLVLHLRTPDWWVTFDLDQLTFPLKYEICITDAISGIWVTSIVPSSSIAATVGRLYETNYERVIRSVIFPSSLLISSGELLRSFFSGRLQGLIQIKLIMLTKLYLLESPCVALVIWSDLLFFGCELQESQINLIYEVTRFFCLLSIYCIVKIIYGELFVTREQLYGYNNFPRGHYSV